VIFDEAQRAWNLETTADFMRRTGRLTPRTRSVTLVDEYDRMKRCDYCGKENEDATETCHGCGTPLPEPPPTGPKSADVPPVISKPVLNAARATQVFVLMFVAQMLGGMIGRAIVVVWAAAHGADLTDREYITTLVNNSPLTLSAVAVASALATVAASILLVGPSLRDTTPAGAAWTLGSRRDLRFGFSLGLLVALASCLINTPLSRVMHPKLGPLTTMGLTRGIPQVTYIILAVLVVPAPEELLFRGVMYGGYFRSFGPRKAAVLTTAIFLLMHVPELIHFLPAALGILGLAVAALHMRLRASAVGPAIAVHVAYNSAIALLSVVFSFLQSQ
jgi:membrane protease YdiL (CAAX protease family)